MTHADIKYGIAEAKRLLVNAYRKKIDLLVDQMNIHDLQIEDIEQAERAILCLEEKVRRINTHSGEQGWPLLKGTPFARVHKKNAPGQYRVLLVTKYY